MTVRLARSSDAGAIVGLIGELAADEGAEVEATPEDLVEAMGNSCQVTVATDESDAVVGMALWFPSFASFLGKPGIWLETLVVTKDRRDQGFGRALLDDLAARSPGILEWGVLVENSKGIGFYESIGAERREHLTVYRWSEVGSPR